MTRRAGQPHDLDAFNSYTGFEPAQRLRAEQREIDWDEYCNEDWDEDSVGASLDPSDDEEVQVVPEPGPADDEEEQVVPESDPADDCHEDMARQAHEEMMAAQRLRGARRRVSFAWCK